MDDAPFGGGPGMVLRPEVLRDTLAAVPREGTGRVIHFSPAAPPLTHAKVLELARLDQLILVCTRYEGLDQRAVERCVDEELSVGEAVLSGGELPALFLIDAVCRWLPGVLGNEASAAAGQLRHGPAGPPPLHAPRDLRGPRRAGRAPGRRPRRHPPLAPPRGHGPHEAAPARPLVHYLKDRLPALDRPAQWCAWQVEHPEDWDRPKPRGWKGFRDHARN